MVWGWQKLTNIPGNAANPIADLSTHQLKKSNLSPIFKNPNKIKQNPKSSSSNHLSYPISSKHTKIKHFSHFTTQKSNHHLTKNPSTNLKLSLFIGTFTDNDFSSKNSKSYNPNIGTIIKLHAKLSRQ